VEYSVADGHLKQTFVDTPDRVYELLAGWAFDRFGWKQTQSWKPLIFDWAIDDLIAHCEVAADDGEVRIKFEPLDIEVTGKDRGQAEAVLRSAVRMVSNSSEKYAKVWTHWASEHLAEAPKAD